MFILWVCALYHQINIFLHHLFFGLFPTALHFTFIFFMVFVDFSVEEKVHGRVVVCLNSCFINRSFYFSGDLHY